MRITTQRDMSRISSRTLSPELLVRASFDKSKMFLTFGMFFLRRDAEEICKNVQIGKKELFNHQSDYVTHLYLQSIF